MVLESMSRIPVTLALTLLYICVCVFSGLQKNYTSSTRFMSLFEFFPLVKLLAHGWNAPITQIFHLFFFFFSSYLYIYLLFHIIYMIRISFQSHEWRDGETKDIPLSHINYSNSTISIGLKHTYFSC